ncbi:proteasome assembly chaperone 2-like isoform X2 [Hydractinia symbiolongicarpus]|uniref:proteasome assembly chaperone 2-like isoform X2 n=2 Tax=Hydractinia symbiolongicarpus TaxID=13093 RepID=UPI00254DE9C9|nr:proteasome assembly chaperone 2-like isoform X2 [Hydractinia symbiolongicarpus]
MAWKILYHIKKAKIPKDEGAKPNMSGVSVGNVGQLAVDLFLANLGDNVQKISAIYDEAVLPVVGKDQFNQGTCTSLELFKGNKIILLQQRSPFAKGRIPSFRRKLVKWIKDCEFSDVFMLSSVSSHVRKDKDIAGSTIRYLTNSQCVKETAADKSWLEYCVTKNSDKEDDYHLPGAGIVKSLYEECKRNSVTFTAFLIFCNPGNNIVEATQLVMHANSYLQLFKMADDDQLKMPLSWKVPLKCETGYIF